MHTIYEVIKRPIISEKSSALMELVRRYTFEVAVQANKQEIKAAVQKLFNVKVQNVHTLLVHGKVKRAGRSQIKRANWKKALVTLEEGHSIDFFQTK